MMNPRPIGLPLPLAPLGIQAISFDGALFTVNNKQSLQNIDAMQTVIRISPMEKINTLFPKLVYEHAFVLDQFNRLSTDARTFPPTHPLKSIGLWTRIRHLEQFQSNHLDRFKAWTLAQFSQRDHTVISPSDCTSVPYVKLTKESTRVGRDYILAIFTGFRLIASTLYSLEIGASFDVIINALNTDTDAMEIYYDIFLLITLWDTVCSVFRSMRYDSPQNVIIGLPTSTLTEVATIFTLKFTSLMEDCRNTTGPFTLLPHHLFFAENGIFNTMTFRASGSILKDRSPHVPTPPPSPSPSPRAASPSAGGKRGADHSTFESKETEKKIKSESGAGVQFAPNVPNDKRGKLCARNLAHQLGVLTHLGSAVQCTQGARCPFSHDPTLFTKQEAIETVSTSTSMTLQLKKSIDSAIRTAQRKLFKA